MALQATLEAMALDLASAIMRAVIEPPVAELATPTKKRTAKRRTTKKRTAKKAKRR
jgi:hypothetical protein